MFHTDVKVLRCCQHCRTAFKVVTLGAATRMGLDVPAPLSAASPAHYQREIASVRILFRNAAPSYQHEG